ncbi:reverse transcriptase domain-containing protein [Tanacetum coccineum]
MPFGLKNAGATYQRLVDKAFQKQIGRNLEIYVDDLVIMSRTEQRIYKGWISRETFKDPKREINKKMNPKKCTFGVEEDFIVERLEDDSLAAPMEVKEELPDPWTLFIDGSSCIDGSKAGLILINSKGKEFTYALRFEFDATNNEAEYEALIASLRITEQMGIKTLQAHVDSRLVANQVKMSYIAKELGMIQYLEKVKTLTGSFKKFSIKQVPRSKNKKADTLSKIASTSFAHLTKQVLVEVLKEKSINEAEVLTVVEEEGNTLRKKHSLRKRRKQGRKDPAACTLGQDFQVHRPMSRNPQQKLTPITSPWPFYKWGIDIAGPFPEGPSKVKFLIVAMDYFTKWIEANPVATITGNQIKKFVFNKIVYRFGLPGEIISDNGM